MSREWLEAWEAIEKIRRRPPLPDDVENAEEKAKRLSEATQDRYLSATELRAITGCDASDDTEKVQQAVEGCKYHQSEEKDVALHEEPMPRGTGVDVANLVHTDIEKRAQHGQKIYGERLTTHNGRDALVDAYQEALDLCVYLRQVLYERDGR